MPPAVPPETFTYAVDRLRTATPREEILLEDIAAPRQLAPYAFALGATVRRGGDEVASGRLVLLHDPAGHEAWQGTFRLVTYVTADLEIDLAADPLLPTVAWSWLTDALLTQEADYVAIGGTITQTTSTRLGELAGSPTTGDVEIRASWTPRGGDLRDHLLAWCALLASAAGLPPPGVSSLPGRRPGAA